MHLTTIAAAVAFLILFRLLLPLLSTFRPSVRSIPGPFLTRLGRLWYFRQVYNGDFHHTNIALHRKYGPIVRIAPTYYSITTPDKSVYGLRSQFPKDIWYKGWQHPAPDRWTLFTDQNIKRHNETRKRFQHLYSMSSLVSYESYADTCAEMFLKKLRGFRDAGTVVDMGHWFQCYAFDVIGSITYSKRFGFLDEGKDIGGTIAALDKNMVYSTLVGIYPWAHPTLYSFLENWFPKSGAAGRSFIMKFVQGRLDTRNEERKEGKVASGKRPEEEKNPRPEDFLNKMLDAHDEDPEKVTNYHVFMMGNSNIIAGTDTTAVSLSSILYHLMKHPETMKKLQAEIATFTTEGKCGAEKVTFAESQQMPYLQAVFKEALRLHPATGLPLWRVVPEDGAVVQGVYLPGGTAVGINSWVAHFNEDVFGPDAKTFRPDRWIEAEKEGGERYKAMEAHWMPFGLGSRTCIGRHISHLEMSTLVPRIVREFNFELPNPNEEWKAGNYWFVKPTNFKVKIKPRKS